LLDFLRALIVASLTLRDGLRQRGRIIYLILFPPLKRRAIASRPLRGLRLGAATPAVQSRRDLGARAAGAGKSGGEIAKIAENCQKSKLECEAFSAQLSAISRGKGREIGLEWDIAGPCTFPLKKGREPLARIGLSWYSNKRRKRCGSRCDVQRGAGTVGRKEVESTGNPGHLSLSR